MDSSRSILLALVVPLLGAVLWSACGDRPRQEPAVTAEDVAPEFEGNALQRVALELDSLNRQILRHVVRMRVLQSPEEQHRRLADHTGQVRVLLDALDRQHTELAGGRQLPDAEMAEILGLSVEDWNRLEDRMAGVRLDLEQFRNASVDFVGRRMDAHLDRLEDILDIMEVAASHLRR